MDDLLLILGWGMLPAALLFYFVVGVLHPWIVAKRLGVPIGAMSIFQLRLVGVNAMRVIHTLHAAKPFEPELSENEVSELYQAGADLKGIVQRLQDAERNGEAVDFWKVAEAHLPQDTQLKSRKPEDPQSD